jgi:hypothetical protein
VANSTRRLPASRPRRRRRTAIVATLTVFCGAAVGAPLGHSQGTGFTGDFWYRIVGGNYTVVGPSGLESTAEYHSYGFNSATNISASNNGYVQSQIYNMSNAGALAAEAYGYNLARACVHGSYPNCTDTDGWSGLGYIFNRSSVNLRLKGHGVY